MFAVCRKPWAGNAMLNLSNVTSAGLLASVQPRLPVPIFAWVSSSYIHHLLDPARKAAKDRLKLIIYLQGNSRRVV